MPRVKVNPPPPKESKRPSDRFTIAEVLPDGTRARRVIPLTAKELIKLRQWEIDYRFVRECEFLERNGRVESRARLELSVGLDTGSLGTIRNGIRGVSAINIVLLWELYRGDRDFILLGTPRNDELYKAWISGKGRLDIYEPYYHRYTSTARWKCGPRAETLTPHPSLPVWSAYFPEDPKNEKWEPPKRSSIADFKEGKETATDNDE